MKEYIMKILERFAPIIISLTLSIVILLSGFRLNKLAEYNGLFANSISFASIFLGVLATLIGLLLGYVDKIVIQKIKAKNADDLLIKYFIFPIMSGIVTVILSFTLGIVFDEKVISNENILSIITFVWLIFSFYFIASTIRIIFLMLKILKEIFYENNLEVERTSTIGDIEINFDEPDF